MPGKVNAGTDSLLKYGAASVGGAVVRYALRVSQIRGHTVLSLSW
jgi:hypothetical protein